MNEIVVVMDAEEARLRTNRVRQYVASIRHDLYAVYTRDGWKALGYSSWHRYLTTEFPDTSHSYLRRQTHAALLEAELADDHSQIGMNKEAHIRPLQEVLDGDTDRMAEAYHLTKERYDEPMAVDFQAAAWEVYVESKGEVRLRDRWRTGELSTRDAYLLCKLHESCDEGPVKSLIPTCSDPDIVPILVRLHKQGANTWDEIWASGTIPNLRNPIPLGQATSDSLLDALDYASNEHRMIGGLERQVQDERRSAAILELLEAMRYLMEINPDAWAISGRDWKQVSVAISDAMAATLKHDEVKDETGNDTGNGEHTGYGE